METARCSRRKILEERSFLFGTSKNAVSCLWLVVLLHLQHSGRIGKIAALSSNILKIKPIYRIAGWKSMWAVLPTAAVKRHCRTGKTDSWSFQKSGEKSSWLHCHGWYHRCSGKCSYRSIAQSRTATSELVSPFVNATIASPHGSLAPGICIAKRYEYFILYKLHNKIPFVDSMKKGDF